MVPQKVKIWTIGHSNRSFENFLTLLKENTIKIVVDIRRFPTSKWQHFIKENLEALLEKNGIKYIHLGQELGGFRSGGYKKYMRTKAFRKGIDELLYIAKKDSACIMCAEWNPMACHRWYVSEYLSKLRCEVMHIISRTNIKSHEELPPKKK